MKIHRLYTAESMEVGSQISLDGKAAHYLSRVLRLARNDKIVLFNGDGYDYLCALDDFSRERVAVRVVDCLENDSGSPLKITLAQAMSRGERMDYTLQKASELGVEAVQLLVSERVELKLADARLEKRLGHWQGVIRAACEQCGRSTLPVLRPPITLHDWLETAGHKLVLDAGADTRLSRVQVHGHVEIAIGPEGGFSESELELLTKSGVQAVKMGPRILRTETAGPAAIAVLQALAGDF